MPESNIGRPGLHKKGREENLPFCDANHWLITRTVTCEGRMREVRLAPIEASTGAILEVHCDGQGIVAFRLAGGLRSIRLGGRGASGDTTGADTRRQSGRAVFYARLGEYQVGPGEAHTTRHRHFASASRGWTPWSTARRRHHRRQAAYPGGTQEIRRCRRRAFVHSRRAAASRGAVRGVECGGGA